MVYFLILIIIILYLLIRLKKLEDTTPRIIENKKGGYKITYKNKTIYNANPE